MWAKVKSEKVEHFMCTIYPKVIVFGIWCCLNLWNNRSRCFFLSLQRYFHPLLPDNLLLPQEGERSYCVWTLNPANTQLHSSGYRLTRSRSKKPAKRHSQALRKMYRSRHGPQRSAKSPGGCCVCNRWYSTQAQRHLVRECLYCGLICLPLGLNTDGSLIKPN